MKIIKLQIKPTFWNLSMINDSADDNINPQMPCISDDNNYWIPEIEIETGKILSWPENTSAYIYYPIKTKCEIKYFNDNNFICDNSNNYFCPPFLSPLNEAVTFEVDKNGYIKDWNIDNIMSFEKWVESELNTKNNNMENNINIKDFLSIFKPKNKKYDNRNYDKESANKIWIQGLYRIDDINMDSVYDLFNNIIYGMDEVISKHPEVTYSDFVIEPIYMYDIETTILDLVYDYYETDEEYQERLKKLRIKQDKEFEKQCKRDKIMELINNYNKEYNEDFFDDGLPF